MKPMKEYPDCFPQNFASEILPKQAKEENKSVYRVIKFGEIDENSFISTYEEIQRKLIPPKKHLDLNNPGIYSTSCNMEYSEARNMLDIFMRHYPKPFIAKGETEKTCGPSQLTSEREARKDTHVDWWIYKNTNPEDYFKKVENDEE